MAIKLRALFALGVLSALAAGGCGGGDELTNEETSCAAVSEECISECMATRCAPLTNACSSDVACNPERGNLFRCVCGAQLAADYAGVDTCMYRFRGLGGVQASPLADCAMTQCAATCGF